MSSDIAAHLGVFTPPASLPFNQSLYADSFLLMPSRLWAVIVPTGAVMEGHELEGINIKKSMNQQQSLNSLQTHSFTFAPGIQVRVIDRDGASWFIAKDICDVLALRVDNSIRGLDADEKLNTTVKGFARGATIINESGLYSLILKSRKPEAKAFKKWITSEVLPAIRKHGAYAQGAEQLSPKEQANLYAAIAAVAKEAMRRYDLETEHHHWASSRKREMFGEYAAAKIAKGMGAPVKLVHNAGMHGVEVAIKTLAAGKEQP